MKKNLLVKIGAVLMILAGIFEFYYAGVLNQSMSIVAIVLYLFATVLFIVHCLKDRKKTD